MFYPCVQELPYQDPARLFSAFAEREGSLFLDSAQREAANSSYSFIAVDPFRTLSLKKAYQGLNPFTRLKEDLASYCLKAVEGLPPFQGGAAGYIGYEAAHYLEKLPQASEDPLCFPDLVLGFYDLVLAFDQEQKKAWIFSSGFPEQEETPRLARAQERMQALLAEIAIFNNADFSQEEPELKLKVKAALCARDYQALVKKTIDYILAGDIFQANLSMPFYAERPEALKPYALYLKLRQINPAPFAAYMNFDKGQLLSASPERFLKLTQSEIETRPIKGTVARGLSQDEDEAQAQSLLTSVKDRSENVMIVDLLRNDLSRVSEPHSVQVPILCALESYATVHHLVSVVKARLRKDLSAVDLFTACFPGGSITGAPKIRAMEIITELEGRERGPYCGSLVYFGFDGSMDSSITIRSIYINEEKLCLQAGGAVVLDSSPEGEHQEVLLKAKALLKALGCEHDSLD